jgi:hypothetical protein
MKLDSNFQTAEIHVDIRSDLVVALLCLLRGKCG